MARLQLASKQKDAHPNLSSAPGDIACIGQFNPQPQFSSSGGVYGTFHWGGKVTYNWPGTIFINVRIYTIQGNGDNQHYVFEDEGSTQPTVAFTDGRSWFNACLNNVSHRWIAAAHFTYDNITFDPDPLWSSVQTLPCE